MFIVIKSANERDRCKVITLYMNVFFSPDSKIIVPNMLYARYIIVWKNLNKNYRVALILKNTLT